MFDDLDEFEDFKNWVQSSIAQSSWAIMQTHETLPYSLLQDAIQAGLYEPVASSGLNLSVIGYMIRQLIIMFGLQRLAMLQNI